MKTVCWYFSALIGTAATLVMMQAKVVIALSASEVNEIAKNISVRISSQTPGSGVVVKRDGNTYTVLTAAHVVATDDNYEVITRPGHRYEVDNSTIKRLPKVDLAILQFTSGQTYNVARFGDSNQVLEGVSSYVAGFPIRTQAIDQTIYNFTTGTITANASRPLADGYALVYSNNTLPGMSGGPVLDADGKVLGIHGRADTTTEVQNQSFNSAVYIKTGFNLGIPISTFLSLLPETDPDLQFDAPIEPAPVRDFRADDLYLLAWDQYTNGDLSGSLASSTEAIEVNSRFAPAYALRGSIRLILKDQTGALADFNQAIQLNDGIASAYMGRGLIQSALGNPQNAIDDYTQAIQLANGSARAHYNRGVILLNQGKKAEALIDLRKAAEIALRENDQAEYQQALEAIRIASSDCRQSIRNICDR